MKAAGEEFLHIMKPAACEVYLHILMKSKEPVESMSENNVYILRKSFFIHLINVKQRWFNTICSMLTRLLIQ